MADSYQVYTATGVADETFVFDKPYQNQDEVSVFLNGLLQVKDVNYTWSSPSVIKVIGTWANGASVYITRQTQTGPKVTFTGFGISGDDLNLAARQALYIAQENRDKINATLIVNFPNGTLDAQSNRIINVGTPTLPGDAATKSFVETFVASGIGSDASSLLVTATGSTTARSLAARTAYVFNVKDFGAVGDGVTDDTTAINAAVTAAKNAGRGIVYFPAGVYLLTGSISIAPTAIPPNVGSYATPATVCLHGDAAGVSIIYYTGSGTAVSYDGSGTPFNACAVDIRDLSIFGNGTTSQTAISAVDCQFHHNILRNLRIGGFITDDIFLDDCWNGEASNIILGGDGLTTNNALRTSNANQWNYVNLYAINTARGDGKYAFKFEGNTDLCRYILLQADNVANGIYLKNTLAPSLISNFWTEKCVNQTPGGGTGDAVAVKLEDADNTTIMNSQIIWSVSDSIPSITGRLIAIQCINTDNVKVSANNISGGGTVSLGAKALDVDSNCNQIEFEQSNKVNDNYAVNVATGVYWPRMREDGADVSRISDLKRIHIPHWNRSANAAMMLDADINTDGAFDPVLAVLADPAGGQSALSAWSIPDKTADGDVSAVQAAFEIESDLDNVCYNLSLLYCTSGTDSANVIRVSLIPTIVAEGSDVRGFTQSTVSINESATEYKLMRVSTLPALYAASGRMANITVARVSGTSDTSTKTLYILAATLHKFKADWR